MNLFQKLIIVTYLMKSLPCQYSWFLTIKRVLIQGLHGTGKSTHIEQIAATKLAMPED